MLYSALETEVRNILARGATLDAFLPGWIDRTDEDIQKWHNWSWMRVENPTFTIANDLQLDANRPIDLSTTISRLKDIIWFGLIISNVEREIRATSELFVRSRFRRNQQGQPRWYLRADRTLYIWPLAQQDYTARIISYNFTAAPSTAGTETASLRIMPDVIIQGALHKAYSYLGDDLAAAAAFGEYMGKRDEKGRAVSGLIMHKQDDIRRQLEEFGEIPQFGARLGDTSTVPPDLRWFWGRS